ncbi:hypothetical protein LDFHOB_08225 [Candidatus Electronema aureum]
MSSIVMLHAMSECENELKLFGIKERELREIGEKILTACRQTTPHDARAATGQYAYLEGVRSFRNLLCPRGWEPKIENNLEMTFSSEKRISIIVSSGDKHTGNIQIEPRTRNRKGKKTKKAVNLNQLYIFPEMKKSGVGSPYSTWIFLYRIDKEKSEMRMELSLLIEFGKNSNIDHWEKRIVLQPIFFDSFIPAVKPESTPEIEIAIRKRANE